MVAVTLCVTAVVPTVKSASVCPAGMVTVVGNITAPGAFGFSVAEICSVSPPAGAGAQGARLPSRIVHLTPRQESRST